jgi:putative transposase
VRRWRNKFNRTFANRLRYQRPWPADNWLLDEVFTRIQGIQHYLWRAVDQHGVVFDILIQDRRDGHGQVLLQATSEGFAPRVIVTDKLKKYGAAPSASQCRAPAKPIFQ